MNMKTQVENVQREFGNPGTQVEAAALAGFEPQELYDTLTSYDIDIFASLIVVNKPLEVILQSYLRTFFCIGVLAERKRQGDELIKFGKM